jgi:hypothetical protein
MDGTGDDHGEQNKPSLKGQISPGYIHLWNPDLK